MGTHETRHEYDTDRVAKSFAQTAKDRAALAPSTLAPINLDVQLAAETVMRALRGIREMRGSITRELAAFDVGDIDKLQHAEALCHAHITYLAAAARPGPSHSAALARGVDPPEAPRRPERARWSWSR